MKKSFIKKTSFVLALIIILAFILRIYDLRGNSLVADEFLDMNSSYAYSKTGLWQSWDFNRQSVNTDDVFAPRDERAWPYKWQVAQLLKILPPKEDNVRMISVIWGILSGILIYFFSLFFTKNKKVALISAFLFAISVSGLEMNRKLRMYSMFLPLYLSLSWLIYLFIEQPYNGSVRLFFWLKEKAGLNFIYLIPAVLIGALSFIIHPLTATIIITSIFYFIVCLLVGIRTSFMKNRYLWYLVILIIVVFLGGYFASRLIKVPTGGIKFFMDNYGYFTRVVRDYANPVVAYGFLIFGFHYLYSVKKLNRESLWILISLAVPLLSAVFIWKQVQGNQYIFFCLPFTIVLISSGIFFVYEFFRNNLGRNAKIVSLAALAFLIIAVPNLMYFFGSDTTYKRNTDEVADYRKAFSYLKKHKSEGDIVITRNFRNYYMKDFGIKVYDFGGERAKEDLSLAQIEEIVRENPQGWVVIFDNDSIFISKQAKEFIESKMTKVDSSLVRGASKMYTWNNIQSSQNEISSETE